MAQKLKTKKPKTKKLKIRRGDNVIVITGRDKGKTGEIMRVDPKKGRVIVQGVNMVKRHRTPTPGDPGGIVEKEASLHVSNVAHIDPKTDLPTRVGLRVDDGGRKVRYARRSGETIDL